jgi:transposase
MDCASLEQLLGQGLSLAEIGRRFDLHESTVGYWVKKYGLVAVNREKYSARDGLKRAELETLVEMDMSTAQIAEVVGRSKTTVRHWLREFGLSTNMGRKAPGVGGSATTSAAVPPPRHNHVQAPRQWRIPVH